MSRRVQYEAQRQARELRAKHGPLAKVKAAVCCTRCRRELVVKPQVRVNGRVSIELACPRHGTVNPGETYTMGFVETT